MNHQMCGYGHVHRRDGMRPQVVNISHVCKRTQTQPYV